ncbi:hypothetical protein [Ruegeria sp.]|uniref:hypothetical protein n=1 Tax=Ruegeria sp. TaxID=1879320 RepID=UPI002328D725|nr:hypothetical protein [Ruegeria sp.]MDA7963209.1 hypothetical protein [Ruegeria sp.]
MKKWICVAAATLFATASYAEEKAFTCVSDRDGSEVRLSRAAEGDKGRIETKDMAEDAMVFKGVGNMTFVYIEGTSVMTFVVNYDDMSYDLSIKGPGAGTDRGACQETNA